MKKFYPISSSNLTGNEKVYLNNCIDTNWISSLGSYVKEFENKFSEFIDVKYSNSCSSGTTALHLALLSLGIGPGDEVILPSFTFIATMNSVLYTGAKPVFTDVDKNSWCITQEEIQKKITSETKAVIVVHTYGNPAEIEQITTLCRKHKIYLIEDCAESMGATINQKQTGSFGDLSCFSFYGNKIITCGEGGMVSTNNEELSDKIRMLRDHGMSPTKRYFHDLLGFNYRMTNLQAAVGLAQFERLNIFLQERKRVFNEYNLHFKDHKLIQIPFLGDENYRPVNWLYTIMVKSSARELIISKLRKKGIDTRPTFHPCHKMPYINQKLDLPVTEFLSNHGISLPTYVDLSKKDIEYISNTLLKIIDEKS